MVSKVAMSVCALIVAGCLSGVVGTVTQPDPGADLGLLLEDLQRRVSSLAALRGECSLEWKVPSLSSGDAIVLSISGRSACACHKGEVRCAEIRPPVHTWEWDGLPANSTLIAERDLCSPVLTGHSGDVIALRVTTVPVDDAEAFLLFASLSVPSS